MLSRKKVWNYFMALLAAATLLAGSGMAQAKGKKVTLTGKITDTMCGAKHTMMPGIPEKDCITLCMMKMGADYGLVVGDKLYALEGKEADLEKFAGAKVKVSGTLNKMVIHVTEISAS
jgi:hypothetical protein